MIRLLRKELLLLGSHIPFLLTATFFALLLGVVVSFSFQRIGLSDGERATLLPGAVILALLFIASGVFHQTMSLEREQGALLGLYRAGYSGAALFCSKFISNTCLLFGLLMLFLAVLGVLFEPRVFSLGVSLLTVLGVAMLALSALGTLLSMISVLAPSREILFPVIFFPLVLPILGAAILLLREILNDGMLDLWSFPAKLLSGLAVLYFLLGVMLFEETL